MPGTTRCTTEGNTATSDRRVQDNTSVRIRQAKSYAPHPVWSKNSCGFTRVVFQQSPEPFTTLKWVCTLCVWVDHRKEQHVALALMIPLVMKMRHILRQRMAEGRFPKEDQP